MSDKVQMELQLEPEHYACLAVYGNAVRNGFDDAEYTEQHIDNFVGREVTGALDSLERLGYLEKHLWEENEDYLYELTDDEEVKHDASSVMKHVDKEYEGRVYEFVEEFDDTDKEKLLDYGVKIAQ